ncbi:transketolase, partial [Vibrio cholerae O1 str. EC-0012]
MNRKQLANAIR